MGSADPQLKIRLPSDAKAFIEAEARENSSSQSSEIVRAVRAAMKAKGPAGAPTPPSHVHDQSLAKEQTNANE